MGWRQRRKKNSESKGVFITTDYRKDSINFAIKEKIDFDTTANSVYQFAKEFVKVKCPTCNQIVDGKGGGGTAKSHNIEFICKECKTKVVINTPEDGYSVYFNE